MQAETVKRVVSRLMPVLCKPRYDAGCQTLSIEELQKELKDKIYDLDMDLKRCEQTIKTMAKEAKN